MPAGGQQASSALIGRCYQQRLWIPARPSRLRHFVADKACAGMTLRAFSVNAHTVSTTSQQLFAILRAVKFLFAEAKL